MRISLLASSFIFVIFLLTLPASGQNANEIVPPSPNVATLKRFLDYPVDHSTGLADVTIPLYEINLKDFSYPITMSFHASGRKVNSNYSPLGVGWALNSIGFMSREVRQRPDEDYPILETNLASIGSLTDGTPYEQYLSTDMNIPNGYLPGGPGGMIGHEYQKDSEHDIYSYSANGISGRFIFNADREPVPLIYNSHQIGAGLSSWGNTVTDEKGTVYNFGYDADAVEWETPENGIGHPSSWLLSSIKTSAGEEIQFNYGVRFTHNTDDNIVGGRGSYYFMNYATSALIPTCSPEIGNYYDNIQGFHNIAGFSGYDYQVSYLTEIIFSYGTITFTYDQASLRLTGFQVKNTNGEVIRNATFTYIQTPGTPFYIPNNNDHSLQTLQFLDKDNIPVETYGFDYYDDALPLPNSSSLTTDWWGYVNGSRVGGDYIPFDPIANPDVPGWTTVDKTPSFSLKQSGMLKKIQYPTGGTTEFVYESNMYKDFDNQPHEGPGIRIQRMIHDDGTGINKLTNLYTYGEGENGLGKLTRLPSAADFVIQKYHRVIGEVTEPPSPSCGVDLGLDLGTYNVRSFYPMPIPDAREAYSLPTYYEKVTEYAISSTEEKNGKTEYTYSSPYYNTSTQIFHKREWTNPQLMSKKIFRLQATGNVYQPVEETTYEYQDFNYISVPELKIFRQEFIQDEDDRAGRPREALMVGPNGYPTYTVFDNPLESAISKLTSTTHTTYDYDGNHSSTSTNYSYDNHQHMLPTSVETTLSDGKTLESRTKYPSDINIGDYAQMTSSHMLNYPVEQTTLVDNKFTKSSLTMYKPSGTTYVPGKSFVIETKTPLSSFTAFDGTVKDNHYPAAPETELNYDNKANVIEAISKSGVVTSYFWSYDQKLPVVKAQNISQSALAGYVATAATNAGLSTTAWISDVTVEKDKWFTFNTLLRLYCGPKVFITTYTYKPLVGMTSVSDINSVTTYYEYDKFGRLQLVKDKNLNILKKYGYHYKQPVTD